MDHKKRKLTDSERKRLIEAVKINPVIWDKTHPDQCKRNILKVAWDNVAHEMNMDVEVCKTGWKSIRDSERYYKKKASKRGNNSRDFEYNSENSSNDEPWEYTDEMKFLEEEPIPSRLTYSSGMTIPADNMSPDRRSPYSYRSNTPIYRQPSSCLNESMFNVVEIVEYEEQKINNHLKPRRTSDLMPTSSIDISSDRSKSPFSSRNSTNAVAAKRKISDNESFLNHLDFILNKLPIRTSECLQAKIIALAYEALAKRRDQS